MTRATQGRRRHLDVAGGRLLFSTLLILLLGGLPAAAQQKDSDSPGFSRNPNWFPRLYTPYQRQQVAPPLLINTRKITDRIQAGKIQLSIAGTVEAVVENNLEIDTQRYNNFIADTDILRAKSGQAPRGLAGAPIPSGLFATALGAGVGRTQLGGGGGGGGISGRARSVSIPPLGSFDPGLNLGLSIDRTEIPLNTLRVAGVPVVTTHTTAFQIAYQQALVSGTGFSLSFNGTRQSSTQQALRFDPSVNTNFSFALTQRLLNGFGPATNRRFIDVARNNKAIIRESFRQRLTEIVSHAQSAYWDLVAAQEGVRNAEQTLVVAQKLLEDNQRKFEVGVLARLDVVAAQSEVAARNRDLILAQTDGQRKELALKNFFAKRLDSELGDAEVVTTDPLPEPNQADIPTVQDAVALAMRNRPELRQTEQSIRNSEIAARFTRDSLKPTLNFFALFVSRGLSGDRTISSPAGGSPIVLPGGFSQSFRQVREADFPEYAFGVTLTIPLKNRRAQADNFRTRLNQRQQQTALQRQRNQIQVEVRQAITALVQSKSQVEAAHEAVRLATESLEGERRKFEVGVSTSYQVILLERDLMSARFSQVQARINYAKAGVDLARVTGTTLEKAHVDLDEAIR